ncbi:MAG: sigma-54 interaction domain-containing protein [Candidatus Hodarchaeota archaeon]
MMTRTISFNPYWLLFSNSSKMEIVKAIIDQIAPTDITVLIKGESGTGKELVAKAIYSKSERREKPFVKINCAAIPRELLESELFGYEKGAFTGADAKKPGKFELANGGTIFLDEIGEIDISLQSKLLQVLQDGEFSRLGGDGNVSVDTRVISTTKKDLEQAMEDGRFRKDLYYRLNVVGIFISPLRDRKEQIPHLSDYFLTFYNNRYNRHRGPLSPKTLRLFDQYDWPGNVRELENVIKRIVILDSEETVINDLWAHDISSNEQGEISRKETHSIGELNLKEIGREASHRAEREAIGRALYRTRWNRKEAAQLLQVSYKSLLSKIKEYRIDKLNGNTSY